MENDTEDYDQTNSSELQETDYPRMLTKGLSALIVALCCSIGVYGNGISAAIFLHRTMKSPVDCLLGAISVIDLCLLLLLVPVIVLANLSLLLGSLTLYHLHFLAIVYVYPVALMTLSASIWTYVLVAVERYLAVCQPLQRYKLMTVGQAKMAVSVIVMLSVAYNWVRFWEYQMDGIYLDELLRKDPFYFSFYYTSLHLLTHFIAPLSVIVYLHARIVCCLRRPSRVNRLLPRCGDRSSHDDQQKSTTWMIVLLTVGFLIANVLPFVVSLWETLDRQVYDGPSATYVHFISEIANILLVIHASCSFLLYLKFCRRYRRLFRQVTPIPCFCCRTKTESVLRLHPHEMREFSDLFTKLHRSRSDTSAPASPCSALTNVANT